MKLPKIKPCPFCGRPGKIYEWKGAGEFAFAVLCTRLSCNIEGPHAGTGIGAIKKWNRRPGINEAVNKKLSKFLD